VGNYPFARRQVIAHYRLIPSYGLKKKELKKSESAFQKLIVQHGGIEVNPFTLRNESYFL
jgi:hypothetical protein